MTNVERAYEDIAEFVSAHLNDMYFFNKETSLRISQGWIQEYDDKETPRFKWEKEADERITHDGKVLQEVILDSLIKWDVIEVEEGETKDQLYIKHRERMHKIYTQLIKEFSYQEEDIPVVFTTEHLI